MTKLGSLADDTTQSGTWKDPSMLLQSRVHSFGTAGLEIDESKTDFGDERQFKCLGYTIRSDGDSLPLGQLIRGLIQSEKSCSREDLNKYQYFRSLAYQHASNGMHPDFEKACEMLREYTGTFDLDFMQRQPVEEFRHPPPEFWKRSVDEHLVAKLTAPPRIRGLPSMTMTIMLMIVFCHYPVGVA